MGSIAPGVGGPGGRDDEEGATAGRTILGHHRLQRLRVHPELGVHRYEPHRSAREPGDRRGLRHRGVGLLAHVIGSVGEVLAELHVAGGHHGRQVRDRATGREDPSGFFGEAEQVAEPPDHVLLDLGQSGRDLPEVGEAVDRHRQELAQGRGVEATPRDVREVARTARLVGTGGRVAELGEDVLERAALLGRRRLQGERSLQGPVDVLGGRVGQAVDEADHVVDRRLPHRPHLLGRGVEGVSGHARLRRVASIVSSRRLDESVTSSTAGFERLDVSRRGLPEPAHLANELTRGLADLLLRWRDPLRVVPAVA